MIFFKELGFQFNPQFSDKTTTCIVSSKNIFVMIMNEEKFKGFTKKDIVNTKTSVEAILSLFSKNREEVYQVVNKGIELVDLRLLNLKTMGLCIYGDFKI